MINHKARQRGTTEREEERDDYLVYTNKDIWGSRDEAPCILNIGIIRRLMVSLTPLSFYRLPTKKNLR